MSARIIEGPPLKESSFEKSLGVTFYHEIKKLDPNRMAIIDANNEEINYGTVFKVTVQLAKKLRDVGVKKGDVVTVISHNQWKYLATMVASFYVGATVNCLNPDYTKGELKEFLSVCKPAIIFCTSKTFKNIAPLEDEEFLPSNIVSYDDVEPEITRIKNFNDFISNLDDGDFNPVDLNPKESIALILTSSGTTGLPKLVPLTYSNLQPTMIYAHDPYFLDINSKDNLMAFLPFFHVFGNALALASILIGAKLVILEKFIPDRFLSTIQNHKITKLLVVPPILLFLAKHPLVKKYDLSSIEDILVGADSVGRDIEILVEKELNIEAVRQVYGLTEVCGAATMIPRNERRHGSVGKVVSTFKIKVVDPKTGEILPPNQDGELRIKGGGVMKGYMGNSALSENIFDEEGYFKSGDLGCYDEEGYFYIKDRLKEIIKYKGFQVSPAELENLLLKHPAIKDAGVVGIPHERAGEVPIAFVVKQNDQSVTEEDVINYVAENISVQKHLHGGVKFIDEIPKSASGKILRRKLKELL